MIERLRRPGTPAGSRLVRWLDRLVDWGVAGFAGWTVAYHLALWVGASRDAAVILGAGLAAAAIGVVGMVARPPESESSPQPPASSPQHEEDSPARGQRALSLAGVALVAALAAARSSLFWPAALVVSVWFLRGLPGSGEPADRRHRSSVGAIAVLLMALISGYLSAAVVRWTSDDTYYLNRSLVIAESRGPMPYGVDTMHSSGGFPSAEPDNDLGSWHPLAGVVADWTGISPRRLISWVAQPVVAMAAILALWRVLGALGASRPALGTAGALILALFLAGGDRSIWFHIWASNSGRTMLAVVVAPLVLAYILEAARAPSVATATRVALACVAAAGCSAASIVVVPPLLAAGLLTVWPVGRKHIALWIASGAGLVYVGVLGAVAFFAASGLPAEGVGVESVISQWNVGVAGVDASPLVIGVVTGLVFLVGVVGVPGARRYAGFALVLAFAFAVSPLATLYGGKGSTTVFRATWGIVPIALVAVAIDGLLARRPGRIAVAGAMAVALVAGTSVLSVDAALLRPGLDLPRETVDPARRLVALAGDGTVVAGPVPVLQVVPALTTRVRPLVAQVRYALTIDAVAPDFRGEDRIAVTTALETGEYAGTPAQLAALIESFDVAAICLSELAGEQTWVIEMLEGLGFEVVADDGRRTFWTRSSA